MQATLDQQFEAINQQIWEMWRLFEQGHGEYGEQGLDGYGWWARIIALAE